MPPCRLGRKWQDDIKRISDEPHFDWAAMSCKFLNQLNNCHLHKAGSRLCIRCVSATAWPISAAELGSNAARGIRRRPRLFCVRVVLWAGSGLETG
jgi:hypothetical protein